MQRAVAVTFRTLQAPPCRPCPCALPHWWWTRPVAARRPGQAGALPQPHPTCHQAPRGCTLTPCTARARSPSRGTGLKERKDPQGWDPKDISASVWAPPVLPALCLLRRNAAPPGLLPAVSVPVPVPRAAPPHVSRLASPCLCSLHPFCLEQSLHLDPQILCYFNPGADGVRGGASPQPLLGRRDGTWRQGTQHQGHLASTPCYPCRARGAPCSQPHPVGPTLCNRHCLGFKPL